MTLDLSEERFEAILAAPEGLERIRELILRLAVRGELGTQDPTDEPAAELFQRLETDGKTTRGRRTGLPSQSQDSSGLDQRVPRRWLPCRLGDLGSWASGTGFPKRYQGKKKGKYPFFKNSDMNAAGNELELIAAANWVDDSDLKKLKSPSVHPAGTIVFPKIGGAIATNRRRVLVRDSLVDNNCLGIVPHNPLRGDWLLLVLRSLDFTEYQSGTSVPALSQARLEIIPIGLPPRNEQGRIVSKVEELMALCDRLQAARQDRLIAAERLGYAVLDSVG